MMNISEGYCQCGCGQKTNNVPQKRKGYKKDDHYKYIYGHHSKGENNANWKGGNIKDERKNYTYIKIYAPNHPNNCRNKIYKHRDIAEKILGKVLPEKVVIHHHSDNELVICENQAYHNLIHKRKRAIEICGNANWLKCQYCGQYDKPENITITKGRKAHKNCRNSYLKEKRN